MALPVPIFQRRKVRCGSHGWKWSEPGSDPSVLQSPHILPILPSRCGAFVLAAIAKEQVCGVGVFPWVPTAPHLGRKNEPRTS